MDAIKKILVPVDFSDAAGRTVDAAVALARRYEATLVLLHVYALPTYNFPDGAILSSAPMAAELSIASQRGLDHVAQRVAGSGVPFEAMLREGSIDEEILRAADETGADLLVISTHGRRGLTRALMGSVAESVLRSARVPVLVVPRVGESA